MTGMQDCAQLLGADGPFARQVPGFAPRAVQQRMAGAVAAALSGGETLVVEAGTGTGKTFAYLVPALLAGQRVIVSTGTKALQDQLFHRDIPRVREILRAPVEVALLKGRGNYLCRYRMQQALEEPPPPGSLMARDLAAVVRWAERTTSGDRMELTEVAEDSPVWPEVTSTVDNCLGAECPLYDVCHVYQARRAAQAADIIVVNHHLLLADMALKLEGHGDLLPEADAFILDEAHQLPALASRFFSSSLSARQVQELTRDVWRECGAVTAVLPSLRPALDALEVQLQKTRLALHGLPERGAFAAIEADAAAMDALVALAESLQALAAALLEVAARSRGLEAAQQRAERLVQRLRQILPAAAPEAAAAAAGDTRVRWYEIGRGGFTLSITPLDLAPPLQRLREGSGAAWIFTSATLSVAGSCAHFTRQMGLEAPRTLLLDSPFDYARQALLYLPEGLPEPRAADYVDQVVAAIRPVLEASGGRAFLLFTSHRALRRAATLLHDALPWPLLVQGEAPRSHLLAAFRAAGNAVLLGAASFWEGVDVPGDALSCVVIDKLPFSAPGDPVREARERAVRERGEVPFITLQVPEAAIALKQGAGRLLRAVSDRGVLVLCDPRLLSKGYGRVFLDSLPAMPRTRELDAVRRFYAAHAAAPAE